MRNLLVLISAVLLFTFVAASQQGSDQKASQPGVSPIPVAAAHETNPVKPTPESLARGKRQFGYDCAMCHGKDGDGKGDVAADMKLKMSDYTNPNTLKDRTDGELFYIIQNGKGDMPGGEGNRVKTEQLWDLVNYLRSFSKKKGADDNAPDKATDKAPAPEKAPS